MPLTSAKNPLLQEIRRAAAKGRPTADGWVVAEGPHLIAEALRGRWTIERVFATPASLARHADLMARIDAEIVEVAARAFASMASTETSQELLALLRPAAYTWNDLLPPDRPALLAVLDAIQDPGNAGAIFRSAEAFGATGIILLAGSVHTANGKFLRATAGSAFRMPFLETIPAAAFVQRAATFGLRLYALAPTAPRNLLDADLRRPCALIAGNEGHGLSPEIADSAEPISIPSATVESLNAGIASSIALFEAHRQRTAPRAATP